jgi:hypothetical protein
VSVEVQLGLQESDSELLVRAWQNWTRWAGRFPCLSGIGGVDSLRSCSRRWCRTARTPRIGGASASHCRSSSESRLC